MHLSFSTNKPMNIFKGWENHTERISANWKRLVKPSDTVILPGDFSWGLKLEETKKDFEFLENLPGKKILLKGNHDLWWSTSKKLREFLDDNKFNSVDFIFNNCAVCEGYAVAGTRGWFLTISQTRKFYSARRAGWNYRFRRRKKLACPYSPFCITPAFGATRCARKFSAL